MSRRSKETLAVQLFPFLAVLVCTMGSLIFLLLVTTRQIRQRAVAFAAFQVAQQELAAAEAARLPPAIPEPEPEPEPPPTVIVIPPQPVVRPSKPVKLPNQDYALALANRERELSDLKTKWKLKVDQLAKERDVHRAALARQKESIVETVGKCTALKTEIDSLEAQLGQVAGETAATSNQAKDDEARRSLEQQIALLKKQLKAAQVAELEDNDKFQVVPFDPLTGTTRRPIFIECTEQGIRFLPEDITITKDDLNGFTSRANPIAAGTGALINYWMLRNLRQRNTAAEPEPYVLLLVRPSGVCAYYVAMKMLEPIRTAHGYELIEESTSLKLPEIDRDAQAACRAAVDRLLAERENIYRSAMTTGSEGSVFGTYGRGGGSGGGPAGGNGSGTVRGPFSDRTAGPRGGDGNLFTITDVTGNETNRDSDNWDRIEGFEGRPPRRSNGNGSRGPSGAANGSRTGTAQGTGRGDSSGGQAPATSVPGGLSPGGLSPGNLSPGSLAPGSLSRGDPSSGGQGSDGSVFGGLAPVGQVPGGSASGGQGPGGKSSGDQASDGQLADGTSASGDGSTVTNQANGKSGSGATSADPANSSLGGSTAENGGSRGSGGSGSGGSGGTGGQSGRYGSGGSGKGRSSDSMLGASGQVPEVPVGPRPGKKRGRTGLDEYSRR